MADVQAVLERIERESVQTVDFRFTDLRGHWQHIGFAAPCVTAALLEQGVMFDGSAIAGWRDVSQSDMLLKPDLESAVLDPFSAQPSLILIADVAEPSTGLGYERCPRSLAGRAEAHLAATGVADDARIAPQAEFFVFDDVRFEVAVQEGYWRVDAEEGAYNSGTRYEVGNRGHRPQSGAPLAVPPVDQMADLRAEMATMLGTMGLETLRHHHDTAPGQHELSIGFGGLRASADRLQIYKYVVHNVANSYGKTATFLPKPMAFQPGSGLQIQQALWREGAAGVRRSGLRRPVRALPALHRRHPAPRARAQRVHQPDHQQLPASGPGRRRAAPAGLRRAQPLGRGPPAVRRPARGQAGRGPLRRSGRQPLSRLRRAADGRARRHRPPDRPRRGHGPQPLRPAAGGSRRAADGLRELAEALDALDRDRGFLTADEVFTDDLIDAYIALKRAEIEAVDGVPHPVEFQLYYSV